MKLPGACIAASPPWLGKGPTLLRLAPLLRHSRVPLGLVLARSQWQHARGLSLQRLQRAFTGAAVAVRSSRDGEDSALQSLAGHYCSLLDIDSADAAALGHAVDRVFASYGAARSGDAVFVQVMAPARLAVVAATHAVEDGADYYAFSLAASTRTDAVTRGDVAVHTTYIAHEAPLPADADLVRLHRALTELRTLCGTAPLEAELALDDDQLWLLQARPLLLRGPALDARARRRSLAQTQPALCAATSGCAGQQRVLALMPDWNTAELLGSHPRPLALSLFNAAIGTSAWREARRLLGYRALPGVALLQPLAGRPYVDVRASANSLLPRGLAAAPAAALADAWQQRLLENPQLHDRYEFAIAQTCVDFDFAAQWRQRYAAVLGTAPAGYRDELAQITARCLAPATLQRILAASPGRAGLARTGLRFALLARINFVFEALLRSAVARGALAPQRLLQLQRSCRSVTQDLLQASDSAARHYGFLRAGTFEITAPRLAQLGLVGAAAPPSPTAGFRATAQERHALGLLLREAGQTLGADELLHGYRRSREAREQGKYFLSEQVSLCQEALAARAAAQGLERETLSWLDLRTCRGPLDTRALEQAAQARAAHAADAALRLPAVFDTRQPLDVVHIAAGTPTFIGQGRVTAPVLEVRRDTPPASLRPHSVLAIASADPGYDWIFARAPAALITAYGGPNSHMAIRCAELGIPAVLGLGTERWQRLARAAHLSIDAAAQVIIPWNHRPPA
jgi:glutamine kinase